MIYETKLDSSFPNGQFQIYGYSDRNGNRDGILVNIRDDIPTKLIEPQIKTEGFFTELNLTRRKWLLCCSYSPLILDILKYHII